MPATTLIQNLYARSPEEQDVAIAEDLAKEESFPSETPIRETAECLLDRIQGPGKHQFACDFLLAWRAVANGTIVQNQTTRQKYWSRWSEYCSSFRIDPFLQETTKLEQIVLTTGFAARVRTGAYGRGDKIKVQSVTEALAAISKTIELAGQPSPLYKALNEYILPLERLVEGFRREDPPSIPQLAVPISVPWECHRVATESQEISLRFSTYSEWVSTHTHAM